MQSHGHSHSNDTCGHSHTTDDTCCPTGNRLIALDDICVTIDGRRILDGITFVVNRGDFVAITGPNGGGKTTTLRVMLRLMRPDRGDVRYYDTDGKTSVRHLNIGYLPQKNMIDSHFPINVREVIASGLLGTGRHTHQQVSELVDAMLDRVELTEHAAKGIGQLSGGQLQRALLGRALISSPEVLVLDEPLSYLDKHFEGRLYEILRELRDKVTVVLVSHEMTAFGEMATRHLIVDRTLTCCSKSHHYFRDPCD